MRSASALSSAAASRAPSRNRPEPTGRPMGLPDRPCLNRPVGLAMVPFRNRPRPSRVISAKLSDGAPSVIHLLSASGTEGTPPAPPSVCGFLSSPLATEPRLPRHPCHAGHEIAIDAEITILLW